MPEEFILVQNYPCSMITTSNLLLFDKIPINYDKPIA